MQLLKTSSGFVKNFTTLLTGTAMAQAIPVLLQPILRRLFSADVFALFAVYNSITSILIVVTTLRYEMAIVLPEKREGGVALVMLALLINFVFSLLFAIVIAIVPSLVMDVTGWPIHERHWLWAIPVGVFLFSAGQTFNYWLVREKAFRASALNRITRRVSEGALQTTGGLIKWQGALLWGDLVGRAFNLTMAWWQSVKYNFTIKNLSFDNIKFVAGRYKDFPLFQALPAILNTASLMLPVLMVSRFYSADSTAQFDLSRQVLVLPLALVTTAMSQVLLQKFTEQRHNKLPILPGFLKLSFYLTITAVAASLFFVVVGEPLFAFVFGAAWSRAGAWTAILAPAFMIQFVVSPLSILIVALEKIKIGALWQVLYFVAILSLTLFKDLPESSFFKVYAAINILLYAIYWLVVFAIASKYEGAKINK